VLTFSPAEAFFPGNKGFVRILYSDKIVALERIDTELISDAPSYSTSQSSTKVIKKTKSFLQLQKTSKQVPFKRTNSGLSKAISEIDLKPYLKEKGLDVSKDEDLQAALQHVNSLSM
jgi:hypothetical protein